MNPVETTPPRRPRLRRSTAPAALADTPVQITLTVRVADVPACLAAARPFVVFA